MFSIGYIAGFCCILTVLGEDALRGRSRQLQSDWRTTVVPQCRPGYIDVTDGNAHEWACAHYCEGGPNLAQATCQCACLTQAQIDILGIIVGQVPTLAPQATQGPGQIYVTPKPTSTTEQRDPVREFGVGDLNTQSPPPAVGDGNFNVDRPDNPAAPEVTDPAASAVDTTLIVIIASSTFCCLAVVMLGCAFYTGMLQRKPTRVSDLAYVDAPAIALHTPVDNCPVPGATGQELGSRASSRTSCGSRAPQERSSSRRSSNVSQNVVYTNQVYTNQVGGPFYNPQDLEAQGRSASRRSSNASVGGPFYNPQDIQAQGRSSSRRSSNSPAPGGPFHSPQDLPQASSPGSRRNSEAGGASVWAHKVPSDDGRELAPASSKLSVQSGRTSNRRPSRESGDGSPGGSSADSPERRVSNQPRSQTQGTRTTKQSHLTAGDALSVPSNRRPSKQSNLSVDVPGTVPGSRRGSKSSNASATSRS